MSEQPIRVLLIEDDPSGTRLIRELLLADMGLAPSPRFLLEQADRLSAGLERLAADEVDVVLTNLSLPDSLLGADTLLQLQSHAPDLPIVVLTDLDDEALGIAAVRSGAQDYLIKGQVTRPLLVRALRYAIERKRSEEALRQHNRALELLNRASQAFTSTLDLDRVLTIVLDEVRDILNISAVSIWLADETGGLVCRQSSGPAAEIVRGWRLKPGEGIAGWVMNHGESLIIPDTQQDPRYCADADRATGMRLRSILSVPLRARRGVIGVVQAVDATAGRFSAADLTIMEPLAATAANAIENARLYEEAQREIARRGRAEAALREQAATSPPPST